MYSSNSDTLPPRPMSQQLVKRQNADPFAQSSTTTRSRPNSRATTQGSVVSWTSESPTKFSRPASRSYVQSSSDSRCFSPGITAAHSHSGADFFPNSQETLSFARTMKTFTPVAKRSTSIARSKKQQEQQPSGNVLLQLGQYDFYDVERRLRRKKREERQAAAMLNPELTLRSTATVDSSVSGEGGAPSSLQQVVDAATIQAGRGDDCVLLMPGEDAASGALVQVTRPPSTSLNTTAMKNSFKLHEVDGDIRIGLGSRGLGQAACKKIAKTQREESIKASIADADTRLAIESNKPPPPEPEPALTKYYRAKEKLLDGIHQERRANTKEMQQHKKMAKRAEKLKQLEMRKHREEKESRRQAWCAKRDEEAQAAAMLNKLEHISIQEERLRRREDQEQALQRANEVHYRERLIVKEQKMAALQAHINEKRDVARHMNACQKRLETSKKRSLEREVAEKVDLCRDVKQSVDNGLFSSLSRLQKDRNKRGTELRTERKELKAVMDKRQTATVAKQRELRANVVDRSPAGDA